MASDGPKSGGSGTGGAGKIGGAAGVTGSAKNSITPGFLGGAGGGEKPAGLSGGAGVLGAAEDSAINTDLDQKSDDLDGAREGEEDIDDVNYSGSGREADSDDSQGFISGHKGPIATLIGIFITLAGLIGGAQLSQPFSLVEQLRESFNTMQTSVGHRSNVLFKYQLGREVRNPLASKMFGGTVFKVSSKQEAKLRQRGIELEEVNVYGKMKTVMKYTDGGGNVKYIVPDPNDIPSVKNTFPDFEVSDFETSFRTDADFFEAYKGGSLLWRGAIANWFQSLTRKFLGDNKLTRNLFDGFKQQTDENGRLKGGGDLMAKGTEEIVTGGARVTSNDKTDVSDENGVIKADILDENGEIKASSKTTVKTKTTDVAGDTIVRTNGFLEVQGKLTDIAKKIKPDSGGGISGMVQTGTSIICGVGDVIGVIGLVVSGAEALQIIHLITGYLEAIDKVKAGDGDESPIHELHNNLNVRADNDHYDYDPYWGTITPLSDLDNGVKETWDALASNASGMADSGLVKTTTNKTAMESQSAMSLYSGGKINPFDPSVKSLNFSSNIKRIVGGLGVSMAGFGSCAAAKIAANLWGMAEDALEYTACIVGLIGSIVTYGTSSAACGPAVFNLVTKIGLSVAVTAAVTAVISLIVPLATSVITRDLVSNLVGEDLGNALYSGAHMYMGNNHRYNGGSLGTEQEYTQFALAQQETIAEDARYERMVRSPFDASSQYTFLGTLLKQMSTFIGPNTIIGTLNSASNTIGSSVAAILPTVSAMDISDSLYDDYGEFCPYLNSINAVGDAFCNPHVVTDMSTMALDPSDVMYMISDDLIYRTEDGTVENCNSGGAGDDCGLGNSDVKIKGDSQLAKYILFCDQRASGFGIPDQNIANDLASWMDVRTESSVINTVANGAIGGVPALGDLADVVQNAQKLANLGYITGQSCVAGNDLPPENSPMNLGDVDDKALSNMNANNNNEDDNIVTKSISVATPEWDKAKLYQRFIEDQSLMESMGIIGESAVTAFVNDYRKEHPLDNSYEGILARYSGLEKNDVIAVLDAVEYFDYIANYNPTERYAFGQEVKPAGAQELRFDNDQKIAYVVLLNTIEFADVRNRSFVV